MLRDKAGARLNKEMWVHTQRTCSFISTGRHKCILMRILNAKKSNNDINITVNTKAPELAAIVYYGKGIGLRLSPALHHLQSFKTDNCSACRIRTWCSVSKRNSWLWPVILRISPRRAFHVLKVQKQGCGLGFMFRARNSILNLEASGFTNPKGSTYLQMW